MSEQPYPPELPPKQVKHIRVKRNASLRDRFESKIVRLAVHWWWIGGTRNGYGRMATREGLKTAHRISWEIHFGSVPAGMKVLHKCDTPRCCNPAHLFLGTQGDNIRDMFAKGRRRRNYFDELNGEKHPRSKLSFDKARKIRALFAQGVGKHQLAAQYGVSWFCLNNVIKNATWVEAP